MTDHVSILQKYAGRGPELKPHGAGASSDPDLSVATGIEESLGCFGCLRGIRERAPCLELRRKTGQIVAIPYGWIEKFEFDPSEGITLHALGRAIKIKGRNLNAEVRQTVRLFEGITRHRIPWIQEADELSSVKADAKDVVITSIEW